jgi:predicted ATPase
VGGAEDEAALVVGRDRELARVGRLLVEALAGGGRLVLCTGEPGIGKTCLAEEAAVLAASQGMLVAWAQAAGPASTQPYGLWRLVLTDPAISPGGHDGDSRWPTATAVGRRLAAVAADSGLLLVLDDLHRADETSAVLLADLSRELPGTRVLILATWRSTALGTGLPSWLSDQAHAERMDLYGLPADFIVELLAADGLGASPEQAQWVHTQTGGNPSRIRELARAYRLAPQPVLTYCDTELRQSLRGLPVPGIPAYHDLTRRFLGSRCGGLRSAW